MSVFRIRMVGHANLRLPSRHHQLIVVVAPLWCSRILQSGSKPYRELGCSQFGCPMPTLSTSPRRCLTSDARASRSRDCLGGLTVGGDVVPSSRRSPKDPTPRMWGRTTICGKGGREEQMAISDDLRDISQEIYSTDAVHERGFRWHEWIRS
jgi:hypothetical protein